MKRLLSAILSMVLLATAMYVPLAFTAYADASAFEAQHMEVNFDGYDAANTYKIYQGVASTASTTVWDGTKSSGSYDTDFRSGWAGGKGTATDPYRISTAKQLARLAWLCANNGTSKMTDWWYTETYNKYWVLTTDIVLNNTTVEDWYSNSEGLHSWYTTTNTDKSFNGHFDGQGHTIKGLYINTDTANARAGLFGSLGSGAVVENIKITDSYIHAPRAGAIHGCFNYSASNDYSDTTTHPIPVIRNCYIDESVKIDGTNAGGITGYGENKKGIVENCYVGAAITGTTARAFNGGGWTAPYTITNSYSTTSLEAGYGSLVKSHVKVAADSILGADAKTKMPKLDYANTWVTLPDSKPQLRVFCNKDAYQPCSVETSGTDKYMKIEKSAGSFTAAGEEYQVGFMLNPTGAANAQVYKLKAGGKYRVALNYIASSGVKVAAYSANSADCASVTDMVSLGSQALPAAEDYSDFSFDFTVPEDLDDSGVNALYLAFETEYNYDGTTSFTVNVTDVVVDRLAAGSTNSFWDGTVAADWAGGSGTKEDPYQIATAGQLAKLASLAKYNNAWHADQYAKTGGKYWVLTADIELNNTTDSDWYTNSSVQKWNYWVNNTDYAFNGNLNGQGHTIKGLYIKRSTSEDIYAGLFGALGKNAVIENLKISQSYIKAKYAAAVTGGVSNVVTAEDNAPIVRRCHIDDTVKIEGTNVAGIMAYNGKPIKVVSCYVGADITGTGKSGSFIGCSWVGGSGGITVEDSYSSSAIAPFGHQNVTGKNSYANSADKGGFKQFNLAAATGEGAKTAMPNLTYDTIWVTDEGVLPQLKFFAKRYDAIENEALNNPPNPDADKVYYGPWDGTVADSWAGGTGTKDDPYRISTPEQLARLVKQTMSSYWNNYSTKGKYYVLTNDIVINDTSRADWKEHARDWLTSTVNPYGHDCHSKAFAGVLDGKGHVIKGLYTNLEGEGTGAGLFVSVSQNAVIKNLGIEESYLRANMVGAISIRDNNIANSSSSFIACYVEDSVELISTKNADNGMGFAGGIIGYSQRPVLIKYCYVKAKIDGYTKGTNKSYGAFFGSMSNDSYITILGSYTACPDGVPIIGSRSGVGVMAASTYSCNNKDDNSKQILSGVQMFTIERMTGIEAASEENMADFNFNDIWYTVEGNTPKLHVFRDGFTGPDPESVMDPSELVVYDDARPGDVWKGNTISSGLEGEGTETNPYKIATAEDLAYLLRNVIEKSAWDNYLSTGKYYELTADIYLNDVSDPNWRTNNPNEWFISSSNQAQCFAGHLNGAGHVVYGLYINSGDKTYASLLGSIGGNAVVENLGVADAYVYADKKYAAGLFSYVENRPWTERYKQPIIRNCFVAEDVYIIGGCAGGMIAASATTFKMENCYSLATVEGSSTRYGTLIGYHWYKGDLVSPPRTDKTQIINCYAMEPKKIPLLGTLSYMEWIEGTNVYNSNGSTPTVCSVVSHGNMCGEKAVTFLEGFDFENTWQTVEKATPILKVFAEKEHRYTEHFYFTKGPVTISFETYGGTEVEPLVGETGEKLVLPTKVSRGIDVFDGWYVGDKKTWDKPFNIDYFPNDSLTLYAKWIVKGSDQDFEDYPYIDSEEGGMGDDYELFRLGVLGYKMDYVHGGAKSLHRIGQSSDVQIASLASSDTVKLVKGGEYEFTAWVYIKSKGENLETTDLMIAHLPDYDWVYTVSDLEAVGDLSKLKVGEWQQIKYKFVATEEHIGIATPGDIDMFIDDVTVTPTGKTSLTNKNLLGIYTEKVVENTVTIKVPVEATTELEEEENVQEVKEESNKSTVRKVVIKRRKVNKFGLTEILIIVGSSVLVVAAATVLLIVIKKRKKSKIKI